MKRLITILMVMVLLALPAQVVLGAADSDTGGADSSQQPANLMIEIGTGTISQITLVDKAAADADLMALAADSGDTTDGMPSDADGTYDWWVYTSDGLGSPAMTWTEDDTNTNAYYRISGVNDQTISVETQGGVTYTFDPDDWIFFKDDGSTSGSYYYGPRTFSVTMDAADATITEPAGATAAGEGSVSLRLLYWDGSSWSTVSKTIALVFDDGTDKLYIDDDLDMTEETDTATAPAISKVEDDTSAVGGDAYAQGAYLEKGSEIEIAGDIQYVLETDVGGMTGTGGTVTFCVGQFSGYDQTEDSTSMGMEIAILFPELMPSGQSVDFTLTLTALEHENKP